MGGRLRRFGVSVAVTVGVFVYLALPTLRDMFGQVVNIPVYAGIALLAGAVTWTVVRGISDAVEAEPSDLEARRRLAADGDGEDDEETEEPARPEPDVDKEMEQLREDL